MANRRFIQFFNTLHTAPVLIDCNFVIDADNTNGLGIRSLKGPGVANVYGHTSATPAAGNPNPPAGYFIIELEDNYYRSFGGFSGFVTATSGTPILVASAGVTAELVYIITDVGTTTQAGWESLGLPHGVQAAVGVAFVATATATATGTGVVQVPNVNGSGITHVEAVGNGNLSLGPVGLGHANPYLIIRTMGPTNSSTTTPIAKAPAEESVMSVAMYLSNSSVLVQGE